MTNREAMIHRINYVFDQIGDDANIYIGMHLFRDETKISVMNISLMDVVRVSDVDGCFGGVVKHRLMQPTDKLDFQKNYA